MCGIAHKPHTCRTLCGISPTSSTWSRGNPFASLARMTSVLIVDDEPAVRDIMSRWVASLGLQSHTATNADEALATFRRITSTWRLSMS